jgi:tRNA (guanine-N7-)-methyltransferase
MNSTGDEEDDHRGIAGDLRSFGRRHGRKLSPRQEALLRELLPRVQVDMVSDPLGLTPIATSRTVSDPEGLIPPQTPPLWLEIGFGGAEHLVWQAEHNPGVTIIGCEPFEEGVVKALSAIDSRGLANVRLHPDDARPLLRRLPPASLDRCFVLFPDPWPKKRHVKRRLVNAATLALIVRALKPGGELRIGTDIGDYARTILIAARATPALRWTATCAADWRLRPADWPETRYEAKAIREGRRRYFLRFERLAAAPD